MAISIQCISTGMSDSINAHRKLRVVAVTGCILVSTFPQQPLEEQLQCPSCLLVDFAKLEVPSQMHVAFMALHQFTADKGALPGPRYSMCMPVCLHVCAHTGPHKLTLYLCIHSSINPRVCVYTGVQWMLML